MSERELERILAEEDEQTVNEALKAWEEQGQRNFLKSVDNYNKASIIIIKK